MSALFELLRRIDCFGVTFNFYTEKNRKFYSPFGGLLTLLAILLGIFIFIYAERDDILHKSPMSTTSESNKEYTKISFLKEKIWIPWRIRDYHAKTLNFSNLLYPIVFYYRAIYNETKKGLDIKRSVLNYRLCNETSMAKNKDSYILDIDLDKVYCIEMDDIEMGGSWDTNYIFYVKFDLYTCKNGITYDEKNPNCTTYEKIIEAAGEDNSFSFDLYYPVVHYQPMVKDNPLFVKYTNYFYHLSRYSNKIDRLFLRKYKLTDDTGYIQANIKNITRWGYVSFKGDSYSIGDDKDLMNEGSSSRLYSFNIYINPEVVYYERSYKKLYIIIANGFPNINLTFIILRALAEMFGIALRNKKLTEFLFENIQEKPSILSLNRNKTRKRLYSNENVQTSRLNLNNKKDDIPFNLYSQNKKGQETIKKLIVKRQISMYNMDKSKLYQNLNIYDLMTNNNFNIEKTFHKNDGNTIKNNTNLKKSIKKHNHHGSSYHLPKLHLRKKHNLENMDKVKNKNNIFLPINKDNYIQKQLFPFRYYFFSIFTKMNITKNSNKSFFYTNRFILVYNFFCQLFDISSYIILKREFQVLKNIMKIRKYKALIENTQKININNQSFYDDIIDSINSNKFSIFYKFNGLKDMHNHYNV